MAADFRPGDPVWYSAHRGGYGDAEYPATVARIGRRRVSIVLGLPSGGTVLRAVDPRNLRRADRPTGDGDA